MGLMISTGEVKAEIIITARAMSDGRISLIDGIRKICALSVATGEPDNEIFLAFRALESETDHYPLGEVRSQYSSNYLQKLDTELHMYISDRTPLILDECKRVILKYS
jgi:hypothetical protein